MQRDFFSRREFSFTIADDIYIRYQSFRTKEEMTSAIMKRNPHKIDIGAVFSAPPKDHNTINPSAFKTVERELVFDIDMTDYDDIRTCCSGANICLRCWPYMTMAIKVVHEILREDFGFEHILWVYSGRRGVHCWVCDQKARQLSNEARTAIVEYMSVNCSALQSTHPMHPMLTRAYDTLEPYFERCIADGTTGQGVFEKKELYVKILNTLPNQTIRKELYDKWENSTMTGAEKWISLKEATTQSFSKEALNAARRAKIDFNELSLWKHTLVFTHCYPRLDANVSKAQNHLLKSPFCVHPKTGRVCVTMDPSQADSFNPFNVPTVRSLCAQVYLLTTYSITCFTRILILIVALD